MWCRDRRGGRRSRPASGVLAALKPSASLKLSASLKFSAALILGVAPLLAQAPAQPGTPADPAALAEPAAPAGPSRHTPGGPILHRESDAAQEVTTIIKCACGGCVNQTLHECECGYASQERARIESRLQQGATTTQLVDEYIAQHGPQIRIVPEKRGLGLVGFLMPFVAAIAGIAALVVVLISWRRRTVAAGTAGSAPPSEADRRYLERLEQDLGKLDA